jgi:hypothetical protein
MPTKFGSIWAQFIDWRFAQNTIHTYEVRPNHRSVTAEAAISLITSTGSYWGETGISRVVSSSGNETFNPPSPSVSRTGVTLIEFRTAASNALVRARHVIHYWD